MSGAGDSRPWDRKEIRRVQILIRRCMEYYMTKDETVSALASNEQIEPALAQLAWELLESKNQYLFRIYFQKLMEARYIPRNNEARSSSVRSEPRGHSPPPTITEGMHDSTTKKTLGSSYYSSGTFKFMPTPRFPNVEGSGETSGAKDVQIQQNVQLRPFTNTAPSTTMASSKSDYSEGNSPSRDTIFPDLSINPDYTEWLADSDCYVKDMNIPEWLQEPTDQEEQKDDRLDKDVSSSKDVSVKIPDDVN